MPTPVAAAFLAALPAPRRAAFAARPDLERALAEALAAARRRRPAVTGDELAFAAHLAARLPDDEPADPLLSTVVVADLWLAYACGRGDPAALAAFEQEMQPPIAAALARLGTAEIAAEARQMLRWQLFVRGPDKPARIDDYAGRGELGAFVRVIVTRLALAELRKQRPAERDDDWLLAIPAGDDPRLAHLKRQCRDELKAAFRAALAGLEPRLRAVLRYQLVDGLTIDDLGAIYQVHRATIARWAQRARDELQAATHRELRDRLRLPGADVDSLVRLAHSQLDLSVQRLLEAEPEG